MRPFVSITMVLTLALVFVTNFDTARSGDSDVVAKTRVLGGRLARKNEIPYIVALYSGGNDSGFSARNICGGSIISKKFILTAAHCLSKWKNGIPNFRVIAGTNDHTMTAGAQVIYVKTNISHPGFAMKYEPAAKAMNDIAVLELEKILEFNDAVQPIALPPAGTVPSGKATVSGWGSTYIEKSGRPGDKSDKLMTVDVMVVPRQTCDKFFRKIPRKDVDGENKNSTEIGLPVPDVKAMCAGGIGEAGKDACGGDSGGPLQCSRKIGEKIEKYLCGVVSYGFGCGTKVPGVYMDVAQFHDWITENTKE